MLDRGQRSAVEVGALEVIEVDDRGVIGDTVEVLTQPFQLTVALKRITNQGEIWPLRGSAACG